MRSELGFVLILAQNVFKQFLNRSFIEKHTSIYIYIYIFLGRASPESLSLSLSLSIQVSTFAVSMYIFSCILAQASLHTWLSHAAVMCHDVCKTTYRRPDCCSS